MVLLGTHQRPELNHIITNRLSYKKYMCFKIYYLLVKGKFFWRTYLVDADLTEDFFFWGYLKHKVYARNPKNKQELRQFIVEEFNTIPQNIIENSYLSVIQRLEHCYENRGDPVYVTYHKNSFANIFLLISVHFSFKKKEIKFLFNFYILIKNSFFFIK